MANDQTQSLSGATRIQIVGAVAAALGVGLYNLGLALGAEIPNIPGGVKCDHGSSDGSKDSP